MAAVGWVDVTFTNYIPSYVLYRTNNEWRRCDVKEKYSKNNKNKILRSIQVGKRQWPFFVSEPFIGTPKGISREKYNNKKLVLSSGLICPKLIMVCRLKVLYFDFFDFHSRTTIIGKCVCYYICVKHLLCEGQIYLENKLIPIEMHFALQLFRNDFCRSRNTETNLNAELCCATILTIHFSCIIIPRVILRWDHLCYTVTIFSSCCYDLM